MRDEDEGTWGCVRERESGFGFWNAPLLSPFTLLTNLPYHYYSTPNVLLYPTRMPPTKSEGKRCITRIPNPCIIHLWIIIDHWSLILDHVGWHAATACSCPFSHPRKISYSEIHRLLPRNQAEIRAPSTPPTSNELFGLLVVWWLSRTLH